MTVKKNINYNHLGVIIISLLTIIWTLFQESIDYWILILLPFLPLYLSLSYIKIELLKKILILIELMWVIFLFFTGFYFQKYEFGEHILPLLLLFLNVVFRVTGFVKLFVIKNPAFISFTVSMFISICIYWYGTTEYLRIGF